MPAAKALKGQMFLFTNTGEQKAWTAPTELPCLDGVKEIAFDTETTGKNKRKDLPIGLSYRTDDGRKGYLPWNHAGGNLEAAAVKRWAQTELRNKKLVGLNIGFDAEVMLRWGVDLEAQGNQLYDVAHGAALLNENRYAGFNLADLGLEYCGRPKLDEALEKDRMSDYHASMVGAYAEEDANLTWDVYQAQRPLIAKDNLEKVDDLESKLIWSNNHIERNGARLDVRRLHEFRAALDQELTELGIDIWKNTGVRLEPNKADTWDRLSVVSGLDPHHVSVNAKGEPVSSYDEDYLKDVVKKNPTLSAFADGLRMRRMLGLKSRYIDKWDKARIDDILVYALHQLRAGEDDHGTVVGRYSATNNMHQVYKVENQVKKFGATGYIIRELFIPDDGFEFFTCDGSQLQFRLFAHLSKDKHLIDAYHKGYKDWLAGAKDVDFHQLVADLFKLTRQEAKTNNFALVMGMGRQSMAEGVNLGCNCQTTDYWKWKGSKDDYNEFEDNENHATDCPAREANNMADKYEAEFPSAKKTMEYVVKFAKTQGFVPTLLGRRRRYAEYEVRNGFRQKTRFYKALASWLQGSEADVVKSKLLRVYNERKTLGIHKLRVVKHDELTGDKDKDPVYRERFREVFNIQEIPCRVPISWSYETGKNWRECSGK